MTLMFSTSKNVGKTELPENKQKILFFLDNVENFFVMYLDALVISQLQGKESQQYSFPFLVV